MRAILKTTAAAILAAGLIGGASARADTYWANWQDGPRVDVQYTGGSSNTKAEALTMAATNGGPKLFDAYCVSLGLSIPSGWTNLSPTTVLQLNGLTNASGGYFVNSAFADVGNRLVYLLSTFSYGNGSPVNAGKSEQDVKAAQALAIWATIDKNFKILTGGSHPALSSTVASLYTTYTNWGTGSGQNGYDNNNPLINHDAAFFLTNKPNSSEYQNVIGIRPVPEPSSIAIVAGLIGLGVVGRLRARRTTV